MAGKFIERLSRHPDETRADNLRRWASSIEGTVPIREVKPRQRCRVAGVVRNIRIDPREGRGSVEVAIIDGSGRMVARWLGRPRVTGITLGVGLVLEGIAGGEVGSLSILNPEYTLVPGPEHG